MKPEALIGERVALETPEGDTLYFRVAALVPYAGQTYAVLEEEQGNDQLLITALEPMDDGLFQFVVMDEEDIITAVIEKFVARNISLAMEGLPEEDHEHDCDCGCRHHHVH